MHQHPLWRAEGQSLMSRIRLALLGLGKISIAQHMPSIAADDAYALVGAVSPNSRIEGLATFADLDALFAAREVDAVAVNTPPQVRFRLARAALLAGKHVLLEKPPCATVAELLELAQLADAAQLTLYTGWHSQHAPAVEPARTWLAGKVVQSVTMIWREDVRYWHPGQTWIWKPGGLGVFDPGINGLSILTRILPESVVLSDVQLHVPENCQTPIAADLIGEVGDKGRFTASLDFRQSGTQTWLIEIITDAGTIVLSMGGAELSINGKAQMLGPSREYSSIYRRFAELVAQGRSEVDAMPLSLTSDAFLIGERISAEPFIE